MSYHRATIGSVAFIARIAPPPHRAAITAPPGRERLPPMIGRVKIETGFGLSQREALPDEIKVEITMPNNDDLKELRRIHDKFKALEAAGDNAAADAYYEKHRAAFDWDYDGRYIGPVPYENGWTP